MTRDEIFERLKVVLVELFELNPAAIKMDANLRDELDIDSIDAVDLFLRLKELTGKKIQPEAFKHVRTVADVVDALQGFMADGSGVASA
jgi:acyl carrier protein